ncbi:hypothetical protein LWC35_18235 [Pseudonocardia kujensis]|uniref:hypothetical protein n=1 Tax=Pseudonocardia kujensis TaxID=1128675 RepID=UPI001E43B9F6|nr:hypothetical protein [Pseudonocardia kujensis]MCE0764830.1 hypothetical protein [Pseudonocardia kujensis]
MTLIERLVSIGDVYGLSALSLVHAVNFEVPAPADAITKAREAIIADRGYVSESVIDELIDEMHHTADNAND